MRSYGGDGRVSFGSVPATLCFPVIRMHPKIGRRRTCIANSVLEARGRPLPYMDQSSSSSSRRKHRLAGLQLKARKDIHSNALNAAISTWVHSFTSAFLSTGHVKEPDPLGARAVEQPDRLGCRHQHDLAALSFEQGFRLR